jgi:hypothetical protein
MDASAAEMSPEEIIAAFGLGPQDCFEHEPVMTCDAQVRACVRAHGIDGTPAASINAYTYLA